MKKNKPVQLILKIAVIIAFVVLSTITLKAKAGNYVMSVVNKTLIYFIAVASINLMLGLTGYLNFSTIAFMGLAAFITADLALINIPLFWAILISTVICAILGFFLGLILLKLKGPYFVFGSMGLVYIASVIFNNYVPFSGGPNGRFGYGKLILFGEKISTFYDWYPILLVISIITIWFVFRIKKTALGRSLMAVRDDETAACTLGVNAFRVKVIIFVISCAMCGFAGGLLAAHNGNVSSSLFGMAIGQKFVIMAMLGGVLNPIGSFIGAFLVAWLPETFRFSASWMNIINGIMIIILMIFMPMGLSSLVSMCIKFIKGKILKHGKLNSKNTILKEDASDAMPKS